MLNVKDSSSAASFRSAWSLDGDVVVFPSRVENSKLVDVAEAQMAYSDVADLVKTLAV